MSDPRDANRDGKVSLMEKVKDKMHHKNTTTSYTTTHAGTTGAVPLATTGISPVPVPGSVPIIGLAPVAMAMPLATATTTTAAMPLRTGAAAYDSRDLNRDGYVSTSEKIATSAMPLRTGAAGYDSRDLNRDGIVSSSELRATSGAGRYDSRDLNRDGIVSTSEQLAATHIGNAHLGEEAHLRLHEEQLTISKREVGAGEVDIHKRVLEQHVSQTVAVRREEVIVERRPLSGVADPGYRISSQDETMRVPLFREEIVTEKRVVPTEEVIVRKQEVVDQQTVGATLRSEHVETVQTSANNTSLYNNNAGFINNNNNNNLMSSNMVGSSQLGGIHDARDTNFDGKVSMGEKVQGALHGQKGPVMDSRDLNKDGRVSMGEKAMSKAARG